MARTVAQGSRVDSLVAGVCVALALLALASPPNVRDPLADSVRRTVGVPLVRLQERAERSRNAFLAHDSVTRIVDSLALRATGMESLEAENEQLRRILGLGRRLEWGFIPAEALTARGPGEEYDITLTVGERAGVRPFTPVVAPGGLVGMVSTVDAWQSRAILWTHRDFRASAMSEDESTVGIVQAHLGDGPERYLLEMRGVPFRSSLTTGTMVVTSGLGGTFPRGIRIGTVIGEVQTSEKWARTYLLRPAVRPTEVASVMVLLPPRIAASVESVWRSAASADSAARAVAAAGDSLRRDSIAAVVARRRAVADSLRADSLRRFPPVPERRPGAVAGPAPDSARPRPRPERPRRPDTTTTTTTTTTTAPAPGAAPPPLPASPTPP